MKNIINFFIITILFLSSFSSMIGQGSNPAFVHLPDLTGYPQPAQHLQDDLEDAATALRMALDSICRPDFAVYDLGFYAHHSKMTGGIPDIITNAIANRITHPYYLLFGREMDDQGDLKRVWVEVELPDTGEFECIDLIAPGFKISILKKIKFIIQSTHEKLDNTPPNNYISSEIAAIDTLRYFVNNIISCCNSNFSSSGGCITCLFTGLEVVEYLEINDYIKLPITIIQLNKLESLDCGVNSILPRFY